MAAAPSRCLLVTGPPVSALNPHGTLPLSRNNSLTTPACGTRRAWGRRRWSCGCSKPSEAPTRISTFGDSIPVPRCLAPLELRLVPLPQSGDQEFYQFLCVIISLFAGEVREGGERVGFEVVTLDGRSGPLSSSKVSRLPLCLFFV